MKSRIKRLLTASFTAPSIITVCIIVAILIVGRGRIRERPQSVSPMLYLPLVLNRFPHKRGVAVCYNRCDVTHAVGALYTRGWWPGAPIRCKGVVSVPCMCRAHTADMVLDGQLELGGNSSIVLSVNEPELEAQGNISPIDWLPYQHALVHQFPQYDWASPATVFWPHWLEEFVDLYVAEYSEFPFSVLDFHCYYPTAQECIDHAEIYLTWMDEWNARHGNPIEEAWVSEFAFRDIGEATTFLDWLDAEPRIMRYFWYCTEYKPQPPWVPEGFQLAEYRSNPVKLRPLGIMYKNR